MDYIKENSQIMTVETMPKKTGTGDNIVKKWFCLYKNINLSYNNGVINISLTEPVIEGTEWQGAIILENIPVDIYIDGEYASTENLIDGETTVILDLLAGMHEIEVIGELCQSAKTEVTV